MSLIAGRFDSGYAISVQTIGGATRPRWASSRAALLSELPKLPIRTGAEPVRLTDAPAEDDFERWDGLS